MLKITALLFSLLLILLPSCSGNSEELQLLAKKEKELELALQKKESERINSLTAFKNQATQEIEAKNFEVGIQYLDSALAIASSSEENEIIAQKAQINFDLRKYDDAIIGYGALISSDYLLKDTYYQRALCYKEQRMTQEAVDDLKQAVELGNEDALELHEKINPIKKRVAYYETRCCDGTTSNATGRGACSHHGGVCNWNEPVYEEYRKF